MKALSLKEIHPNDLFENFSTFCGGISPNSNSGKKVEIPPRAQPVVRNMKRDARMVTISSQNDEEYYSGKKNLKFLEMMENTFSSDIPTSTRNRTPFLNITERENNLKNKPRLPKAPKNLKLNSLRKIEKVNFWVRKSSSARRRDSKSMFFGGLAGAGGSKINESMYVVNLESRQKRRERKAMSFLVGTQNTQGSHSSLFYSSRNPESSLRDSKKIYAKKQKKRQIFTHSVDYGCKATLIEIRGEHLGHVFGQETEKRSKIENKAFFVQKSQRAKNRHIHALGGEVVSQRSQNAPATSQLESSSSKSKKIENETFEENEGSGQATVEKSGTMESSLMIEQALKIKGSDRSRFFDLVDGGLDQAKNPIFTTMEPEVVHGASFGGPRKPAIPLGNQKFTNYFIQKKIGSMTRTKGLDDFGEARGRPRTQKMQKMSQNGKISSHIFDENGQKIEDLSKVLKRSRTGGDPRGHNPLQRRPKNHQPAMETGRTAPNHSQKNPRNQRKSKQIQERRANEGNKNSKKADNSSFQEFMKLNKSKNSLLSSLKQKIMVKKHQLRKFKRTSQKRSQDTKPGLPVPKIHPKAEKINKNKLSQKIDPKERKQDKKVINVPPVDIEDLTRNQLHRKIQKSRFSGVNHSSHNKDSFGAASLLGYSKSSRDELKTLRRRAGESGNSESVVPEATTNRNSSSRMNTMKLIEMGQLKSTKDQSPENESISLTKFKNSGFLKSLVVKANTRQLAHLESSEQAKRVIETSLYLQKSVEVTGVARNVEKTREIENAEISKNDQNSVDLGEKGVIGHGNRLNKYQKIKNFHLDLNKTGLDLTTIYEPLDRKKTLRRSQKGSSRSRSQEAANKRTGDPRLSRYKNSRQKKIKFPKKILSKKLSRKHSKKSTHCQSEAQWSRDRKYYSISRQLLAGRVAKKLVEFSRDDEQKQRISSLSRSFGRPDADCDSLGGGKRGAVCVGKGRRRRGKGRKENRSFVLERRGSRGFGGFEESGEGKLKHSSFERPPR